MELTKNTSVDPAKMIGKITLKQSMQNFQILFWMRSGQHQIRLPLPLKPICYLTWLNTSIINMKVGYLWYSGMMSVQFMATMQCTTCFPWKGK